MPDNLCKRKTEKPTANRFYAMLIGVAISHSVSATEPTVLSESLSLPEAVNLTLNNHPELQALVSQERVWQGRIQQAAVGERPQIGLMIEDALGTGEHSGIDNMQSTLTFSWLLQQEQINSRIDASKTEAEQLVFDRQIKALDLSALVAKQFIDVLVSQERLKLNRIAMAQAEDLVKAITKRVNAGKSSIIEMRQAKTELIRRKLAVEDANHELKTSRYQLASFWGKPSTQYQIKGNLLSIPTIPSVDNQLALLKQNPRLQKFVSAQRVAQSQMELARIDAKPQWQFTTGIRRYETTDDFGLVAGVAIPFGNDNRNAGTIAALKAQQEVLASEQIALMQSMDAQLYVLLQEMSHSQHVIDTVRTEILPNLESALTEAQHAFDQGQFSYNQYSNVRRELLSAQTQLLDTIERLHLQHIEIQRLTGTSLSQ